MSNHLKNKDSEKSSYTSDDVARSVQAHIASLLTLTADFAERLGLNLTDVAALEHLGNSAPAALSPGELGKRLRLSSGAVTALVDRLERADYVVRQPYPHDRRRMRLVFTANGAKTAKENLEPVLEGVRRLADALTEEERKTVSRFLAETAQVIKAHRLDTTS